MNTDERIRKIDLCMHVGYISMICNSKDMKEKALMRKPQGLEWPGDVEA